MYHIAVQEIIEDYSDHLVIAALLSMTTDVPCAFQFNENDVPICHANARDFKNCNDALQALGPQILEKLRGDTHFPLNRHEKLHIMLLESARRNVFQQVFNGFSPFTDEELNDYNLNHKKHICCRPNKAKLGFYGKTQEFYGEYLNQYGTILIELARSSIEASFREYLKKRWLSYPKEFEKAENGVAVIPYNLRWNNEMSIAISREYPKIRYVIHQEDTTDNIWRITGKNHFPKGKNISVPITTRKFQTIRRSEPLFCEVSTLSAALALTDKYLRN